MHNVYKHYTMRTNERTKMYTLYLERKRERANADCSPDGLEVVCLFQSFFFFLAFFFPSCLAGIFSNHIVQRFICYALNYGKW